MQLPFGIIVQLRYTRRVYKTVAPMAALYYFITAFFLLSVCRQRRCYAGARCCCRPTERHPIILLGNRRRVRSKFDFRKNFALDRANRDDLFLFEQEFQLRWSYRYNDWISFLLEGKVLGEHEAYTSGGARRSEVEPERGETWVRLENLFRRDLTLKLGRQSFEEPRRWWWDDDLDAVGLRYRPNPWQFELA